MPAINPYITFNGNCEEAFNFYKSVFGGEFPYIGRYSEMPGDKVDPKESNLIMHVSLPIGDNTFLFGADMSDAFGGKSKEGSSISISLNADSEAEADKLFDGLSAGGQVTMPLNKTFWGAYFGMFTDKFGINWMVNYDYNQQK
ncbi:MAG: VOC family protein [Bacteroidota bacterium]